MTDLLPCPFCGGPASFEAVGARWTVGCNETNEDSDGGVFEILCYGYQSLTTFATKREGAAAWNRRAPAHPTEPGEPRKLTQDDVEMFDAALIKSVRIVAEGVPVAEVERLRAIETAAREIAKTRRDAEVGWADRQIRAWNNLAAALSTPQPKGEAK